MIQTLLLSAALLAQSQTAPPEPPLKGRLCWFGSPLACVATEGKSIDVAASDTARRFVWSRDDGSSVLLESLAANETSIHLAPKDLRRVTLSLTGDISRGWPHDVALAVQRVKEDLWHWKIPAASVKKLREIRLPSGEYGLTISAPRHRVERRRMNTQADVTLRDVSLKPLPAVSGRLVEMSDEKRVPVAGAQIIGSNSKVQATTQNDGAFRVELEEPVPEELLVVHPRLATQVIPFENSDAETNVGEIVLQSGAKLIVSLKRPDDVTKVRARLLRELEGKYELVPITSRDIDADADVILFDNVARGSYYLVLEGTESLERLPVEIEIDSDEVRKSVDIAPFRLVGSAKFGDEPVKNGTLEFASRFWRATVPLDAEGKFGGSMWQHGKATGFLKAEVLGNGLPVHSPELGSDPTEWTIALKRRLVEGQVLDAVTKQPLPGVSLHMVLSSFPESSERFKQQGSVTVDASGNYRIPAVRDGVYDLEVKHGERLPQSRTIDFRESDESKRVNFLLENGVESTLEVVWASGEPVANATLFEGIARDGYNPRRFFNTDGAGRLPLRSTARETRTLYVLPKEGSFGIARIVAPASMFDAKPTRLVVPAGQSSLLLNFKDADGKAFTRAVPLMRFNGEWLPYPVVGRLRQQRVEGTLKFASLPVGVYEIWAVVGGRDYATITAAPPPNAPVRVGLSGGEQSVNVNVYQP